MSYGKSGYSEPSSDRYGGGGDRYGNGGNRYGGGGGGGGERYGGGTDPYSSYAAPASGTSKFSSMIGRGNVSDRSDATLAEHIKKALSNEEVAPKQKHVRECILYTVCSPSCS
ncbi:hypothetical protein BC830DRAFT_682222, partial [Chytriomyces sp. MP71]